jgi:hypothetical protein
MVRRRAVDLAEEDGGFVSVVVVVPDARHWVNAGWWYTPMPDRAALRAQAEDVLARAAVRIPCGVACAALVEEGRLADVIRRRVDAAAIDVVVARRSHGQRTWHLEAEVVGC